MTFSKKILVGAFAGIATGLFLGEHVAPLGIVGQGFVRLLQMTVLPYVTVSIILSLGSLDLAQARRLGLRAGATIAALWVVALVFACLVPLVFPPAESASFFSAALLENAPPFDFVDLYIPSNPFHSLANSVVPAVVLFSLLLGVALIGIERKAVLLDVLGVVSAHHRQGDPLRQPADAVRHLRVGGECRRHAADRRDRAHRDLPCHLHRHGAAGRAVGAAGTGRGADADSVSGSARTESQCLDHRLQCRGPLHRAAGADRGVQDAPGPLRRHRSAVGRAARHDRAGVVQFSRTPESCCR